MNNSVLAQALDQKNIVSVAQSRWRSPLLLGVFAYFIFESITGFLLFFFAAFVSVGSIIPTLHWITGAVFLLPYAVYQFKHWLRVKHLKQTLSYKLGLYTFFSFLLVILSGIPIIAELKLTESLASLVTLVHVVTSSIFLIFLSSHLVLVFRKHFLS